MINKKNNARQIGFWNKFIKFPFKKAKKGIANINESIKYISDNILEPIPKPQFLGH